MESLFNELVDAVISISSFSFFWKVYLMHAKRRKIDILTYDQRYTQWVRYDPYEYQTTYQILAENVSARER
jgi:hypothetical protein